MLITTTMKSTKMTDNQVTPVEEEFASDSFSTGVAEFKRFWIERALEQTKGNQLKAAKLLGMNRNTLKKYIVDMKIDLNATRRVAH